MKNFLIGVTVTFLFCLLIGILDKFGYLDPILDKLGIS